MRKEIKIWLFWTGCILFPILFVCCSKNPVFSFDISSRLLGGGKVSMVVDVEFQDPSGIEELKQQLEKIKYALYLVFSRKSAEEMTKLGEQKTANSISQILRRHLNQKANAVRVRQFRIDPKSG